jgi:Haem-binding domain
MNKRRILLIIVIVLIAIQLYRPAKTNPPENAALTLKSQAQVPPELDATFTRSCQDCHTYRTVWPWYSNVAPVSWFVISDVNDGRRHLNLSDWGKYKPEQMQRQLTKMCEEVKQGEMPLKQYTWIHKVAGLDGPQRQQICDWTKAEQARITARTGVQVPPKEREGVHAADNK